MASGTLFTYPDNFRAFKALIAAKYSGADVKVSPGFKFGETNKSKSFLEKFPLGKVPAFESASGDCLFESDAIAQYVSNAQLIGANARDAAFVQQWIHFAENEILPALCTWVYPCLGIIQYNKQETEKAKEQIKKALGLLNGYLSKRTFLVGERISLADIAVVCDLLLLYKHVLDPSFRSSFVHTNRWFTTLINQPQFSAVIGPFQMCTKMAEFDSKKYAELHGQQGGGGKKEKKEKQPKQEKQAPKKKEKEPEPEEEDEPKPKESKDPFASYPKGTFNMDEFKREYSNKDTLTEALPYFWKNFDKENFSIWFSEYKYNNELSRIFMTANLVGGMFQRLEKLRKNAFASVCVFGEDNNNSISGIWVWRGHDLAFELSPDWQIDYESYNWTKLNPDDEKTKKLVKEYFAWEGDFDGKKFNQGKIFK
ncbi:elongation factor 1-gamma-like [Saccostrea echinata]|uniref:elongation factor 1-gamma-like n=1 Tax=Saccostrea echinata TaxID=191078 RepID=UPI002A832F21|nr:elongation factor 1-gamma-like [Saccostrea echinata]